MLAGKLQSCSSVLRDDHSFDWDLASFIVIRRLPEVSMSVCLAESSALLVCTVLHDLSLQWSEGSCWPKPPVPVTWPTFPAALHEHWGAHDLSSDPHVHIPPLSLAMQHPVINKLISITYFWQECVVCNILLTLLPLSSCVNCLSISYRPVQSLLANA